MIDTDEITRLRAENERLRADLRLAIMSDSDECKALSQEVKRLVRSRNRWGHKYNVLLEKHKRLRAALRPFAEAADGFDAARIRNPEEWFAYRAALDGQPAPGKEEA